MRAAKPTPFPETLVVMGKQECIATIWGLSKQDKQAEEEEERIGH
jgi:hypothetical protein